MDKLKTILVVDDEPAILELMGIFLSKWGEKILTAENGLQALELVECNDIDLIISDISMPQMDGIEFFKELRKRNHLTPFAIMTAYENLKEEVEALDLDLLSFISKPMKKDKLANLFDEYKKKAKH